MVVEERLRNKVLYKITLQTLKIISMLLAFVATLNTILSYIGIDNAILSYIGGTSLLPLVFLYLVSYLFKFCAYHRMFLHYIVITDCINIYDYHVGIPLDDLQMLCLYMIITGIFLFIILYLYVKSNKKLVI